MPSLSLATENIPFLLSGWVVMFVIAYMKGAFGGGFALLAVPVLSLTTDPLTAAAATAPLPVVMDAFAIVAHPPRTWSRPHLKRLLPAAVIGLCCGALLLGTVSETLIKAIVGGLAVGFSVKWFLERILDQSLIPLRGASGTLQGGLFGGLSGFTSVLAHAGGPPLAIYLLSRNLSKENYAGTGVGSFAVTNLIKLALYGALGLVTMQTGTMSLLLAPVIPLGIYAGRKGHDLMSAQTIFLICYSLVFLAGLKLLLDVVWTHWPGSMILWTAEG